MSGEFQITIKSILQVHINNMHQWRITDQLQTVANFSFLLGIFPTAVQLFTCEWRKRTNKSAFFLQCDLKLDTGTSSKSNSYLLELHIIWYLPPASHPTNSRTKPALISAPVMTSIEVRYIFCSHWSVQKLTSSAISSVVQLRYSSFSANVQFLSPSHWHSIRWEFPCISFPFWSRSVAVPLLFFIVRYTTLSMDDDDDRGDTSFNSVYYSQLLFPLYTSASRVLCPVQSIQSVSQSFRQPWSATTDRWTVSNPV